MSGFVFPPNMYFDGDGYEIEECSDSIVRGKLRALIE